MATTPNLSITLLEASQSQKEVTVNEALHRIDAVLNNGMIDRGINTPPATPATGDSYIVGSSPTGAWVGHANHVAYFQQIWRFILPKTGLMLWVADEAKHYVFNGTAWQEVDVSGMGGGGSGDMAASVYDPASITQQVLGTTATQTVSNKTIHLSSNTLSGTKAQFNTACSDDDFAYTGTANTFSATQTFTQAPVFTNLSGSRTALGLGSAATQSTGTSGTAVPLLDGANSWSAKQTLATPTTSSASLKLPHGTAPTSPSDGDFWTTTAGLYGRINGSTIAYGAGGGGGGGAGITLGTMVSLSGTAVDFTGIPAGTKRITISLKEASLSGGHNFILQLGDAGGIETSGYSGVCGGITASGNAWTATESSTYFPLNPFGHSPALHSGTITLTLMDSATNLWALSGNFSNTQPGGYAGMGVSGGYKALSATLDRIRLTNSSSDTFDNGYANITYE